LERSAMNEVLKTLMILLVGVTISACSSQGGVSGSGYAPPVEIRTGIIEQINQTEVKSTHDQGLGAIIGGVAGAGIGSLIGAGTGRDVAIAAGAIAGAIGGNVAQNRFFDKPQPAQQVFVRLQSGVLIVITQAVNPALNRGMRVYVEGFGNEARVLPA